MLNSYDVLIPITERDNSILNSLGNKKPSHVSQTGIDFTELVPNAKNLEHPSIFHIGSLEWAPNQDALNWFVDKCWPALHNMFPDLKFYVAGRNAPHWLPKRISSPNVVFVGEVPDAYQFMNSKSVMIVPLFSGSGMRIKIIEGMALGKPIVTTSIGTEGIPTTPGQNILIADDVEGFVKAVASVVSDKELNIRIGRNAIEFIHSEFDNLSASSALMEFYKTLQK
jgi:glycosyltransferase involved in cell wall biosynthesis